MGANTHLLYKNKKIVQQQAQSLVCELGEDIRKVEELCSPRFWPWDVYTPRVNSQLVSSPAETTVTPLRFTRN